MVGESQVEVARRLNQLVVYRLITFKNENVSLSFVHCGCHQRATIQACNQFVRGLEVTKRDTIATVV